MPNINAALGCAQLEVLQKRLQKKINLYELFNEEFKKFHDVELLTAPENTLTNYWLIGLRIMHKDSEKCYELVEKILEKAHLDGLLLRPLWKNLNSLPMYKNNPKGSLSVAENEEKRIINLPSSPQLIIN